MEKFEFIGFDWVFSKFAESLLVPWPQELLKAGLVDMLYIHPKLRYIGELFIDVFLSPPTEMSEKAKASSFISQSKKPQYISAHLRRTDFVHLNRAVPIKRAAKKLVELMKEQNVSKVSKRGFSSAYTELLRVCH